MTHALTIDRATGALDVEGRTQLKPRSGKATAEAALPPLLRRRQDFGTGYLWLYADGLSFGGSPCWLDLCYRMGRLTMASWRVDLGPGSDDREAELAFMRAELGRQLGGNFDREQAFAWGAAWCSHDPRSDAVSSGVRYG